MKFGYKFSNLLGTVYTGGPLLFTKDGGTVLSIVSNKISVFDLVNSNSYCLGYQHPATITRIQLSPDNNFLISIDEDLNLFLGNFHKQVILGGMKLKGLTLGDIKFSPNGRYFAVSIDSHIQIWRTPSLHKEYAPFVLFKDLVNLHFDDVTYLQWSFDSNYLFSSSRDNSIKIHNIESNGMELPLSLLGHTHPIVATFLDKSSKTLYCVDTKNLIIRNWESSSRSEIEEEEEESKLEDVNDINKGKWVFASKHNLVPESSPVKIICSDFHEGTSLLVIATSEGIFSLYDLPDVSQIQSLSVSQSRIDSVKVNSTGEWMCIGSSQQGQLLVWEWQSETYVLKQQSHSLDMNSVIYSSDGQYLATGGDDAKVKIWNCATGVCFVTFSEHSGPVTSLAWSPHTNAVFSSSLDGTVRAFDLIRYKNFRVFSGTNANGTLCQFSSVAVDSSGEIVCAGTLDTFDIYVWSVQTSKLLDRLSGHQGPISGIAFSPVQSHLVSVSWDKCIRIWDVFESKPVQETLSLSTDVLGVSFRPDGKQFCTYSLDSQITLWDTASGNVVGVIEGKKDILGGGFSIQSGSKSNSDVSKHFTSVSYTIDGSCLIAAGNTKFICIYEVSQRVLVKKISATSNKNFDGVLTWSKLKNTEAGSLLQVEDPLEDDTLKYAEYIPGAKRGESMKRNLHPTFRVKSLVSSPTGRSWAAATTEGILLYSLDETLVFDPFELEIDITPENILLKLKEANYLHALLMSLRLNEQDITKKVLDNIPSSEIQFVVRGFPYNYVQRLLNFISNEMSTSPHLEFYLLWSLHIFNYHGRYIKEHSNNFMGILRNLQKNITKQHQDLSNICDDNTYTLDYLVTVFKPEVNQM